MAVKVKRSLLVKYSLGNLFLILTIVVIMSIAAGWLVIQRTRAFTAQNTLNDTLVLFGFLSGSIAENLKIQEDTLLLSTFKQVQAMPNVSFAVLYDRERNIRLHSEVGAAPVLTPENMPLLETLFTNQATTVTPPFDARDVKPAYLISRSFFRSSGEFDGMLVVKFSTANMAELLNALLRNLTLLFVVVGLVAVGAGVLFGIFQARGTVRPIRVLTEGTEKIGERNLDHVIAIDTQDEIGLLARNFNSMTKRLKEIYDHLEDLVAKRTEELNQTLVTVSSLKEQQDGDYFLTTLVIQPLIRNIVSSPHVKVDFMIKQKKNFTFRKKQAEIGGDMCIAAGVTLRGRPCTVFISADAMGKSIQGAGGALVLGVAFNSIIAQTQEGLHDALGADGWIRHCYHELQRAYLPFDGSMYISATLAVLDDQSGQMWYINAEHPWTVLYRDGKASFLESSLEIHKFGMELNPPSQEIEIRALTLAPGDIILTGSDGRDDIDLGLRENGQRLINEDETLFLRHVEASAGDLSQITSRILQTGELTDDLSLIRVQWHGPVVVENPA